jgi:hypothetical protein
MLQRLVTMVASEAKERAEGPTWKYLLGLSRFALAGQRKAGVIQFPR